MELNPYENYKTHQKCACTCGCRNRTAYVDGFYFCDDCYRENHIPDRWAKVMVLGMCGAMLFLLLVQILIWVVRS